MVLLSTPQLRNVRPGSAAVWKMGSGTAVAIAFTISQTVTSGFPFLSPASRHDSHGFLYAWFSMKQMLPDVKVKKLLLDSAHDAMPYYDYCKANNITPFIDLNWKCGRPPVYKDDITIGKDGIPLCPQGFPMKQAAVEPKKGRIKYRCSKISYKGRTPHCTCEKAMLGCQIWTERPSHSERQSKTF